MANGLGDVEGVPADGGAGTVRVTAGVIIVPTLAARLECSTVLVPAEITTVEGRALPVAGGEAATDGVGAEICERAAAVTRIGVLAAIDVTAAVTEGCEITAAVGVSVTAFVDLDALARMLADLVICSSIIACTMLSFSRPLSSFHKAVEESAASDIDAGGDIGSTAASAGLVYVFEEFTSTSPSPSRSGDDFLQRLARRLGGL